MKPTKPNLFLILTPLIAAAISASAAPTDLYWDGGTSFIDEDGDGVSTYIGGAWNDTLTNWDAGVALPHVAWDNTNEADNAIFGGAFTTGTKTVAIDSNITVNQITVLTGGIGAGTGDAGGTNRLDIGSDATQNDAAITFGGTYSDAFPAITGPGGTNGFLYNLFNAKITGDLSAKGGLVILHGSSITGTLSNGSSSTAPTGRLVLANSNNDFVGDVVILGGNVLIESTNATPRSSKFGNAANKIVLKGGALLNNRTTLNTTTTFSRDIEVAAPSGIATVTAVALGVVLDLTGKITGSETLTRYNGGTNSSLRLKGDMSGFTGMVDCAGGSGATLEIQTTAMSQGSWKINGSVLMLSATNDTHIANGAGKSDLLMTSGGTLNMNGKSETINGLSGTGTVQNQLQPTSSVLTLGDGDATASFTGVIRNNSSSGSNALMSLVKIGAGVQTLSGNNSYTGNTTLSGGTLKIGHANALGFGGGIRQFTATGKTIVSGGSTLDLNGSATVTEPLVLNGTGIGGNGALVNNNTSTPAIIGSGIAGLSLPQLGTGSGYSTAPTITINGTGFGATATASMGLTTASITSITNGGTAGWVVGDTLAVTGGSGSGAIATVTTVNGSGQVTGLSLTTPGSGYTGAPTTLAKLTGVGTGTPTITGNATNFTVSGLTLTNAGSGYMEAPSFVFSSGNAASGDVTVALSSVVLVSGSSIGGPGNITVNGLVTESGGTQALTKSGSGTLTLSGVNTYTGATTVNAGTVLVFDTGGSATGSGDVTVKATATFGGTGAVSGAVILESGGTLAPGVSIGSLATGALTLSAGATLAAEIDSSTEDADGVNVTGNLTLGGALNVTDIAGAPAAITLGTKLTLITYSGALTGNFVGKPEGSTFAARGNLFKIRYADSGAVTLEAMGVAPDYSGWALTNAPSQTAAQDYDNDGVSNGVEWVLGGLAASNDAAKLPTVSTTPGGDLVFSFVRKQTSKTADTAVFVQVGTNLSTWTSYPVPDTGTAGPVTVINGAGTDTVTLTVAQAPDAKKFARLNVVITP